MAGLEDSLIFTTLWAPFPALRGPGMVVQDYNHRTQEVEAGDSEVRPCLHSKFKGILDYMGCLSNKERAIAAVQ